MKVLMTGNRNKDLASEIVKVFESAGHPCMCLSRENGYDFQDNPHKTIHRVVEMAADYDLFINCYANYFFYQSTLTYKLFQDWREKKFKDKRIITIGSTTDRVQRGPMNLYHFEKRTLREMCSGLSMDRVWGTEAPFVSYISVGTLENKKEKHPDRETLPLHKVAEYIFWLTQQPEGIHINELSLDPIQTIRK